MKKRYIIGLTITILLVVIYIVSAFLIHQRAEKNTQLAIQQIEANSPAQIHAIHYGSLHITPFSWLKHTMTLKDVVIDLKSFPTPLLIDKLTLTLPSAHQDQVPNSFSIHITGLHVKSLKYIMEQMKATDSKTESQLINLLTAIWPDTLNPKTNINTTFHDKRLTIDYHSYQNDVTYAKGTATLTQVKFNLQDPLNSDNLTDTFNDAVLQSFDEWTNLPLTITQAQLHTTFPLAAGFLGALGYSELDILFHLVSDYKDHQSHVNFSVDVKDAGKLSFRQHSTYQAPIPLFTLSCPVQTSPQSTTPTPPDYPQLVNDLAIAKISLTLENQGIVQRLLTLFAKEANQPVDTLKANITEGIHATISEENIPTLVTAAQAITTFINQPDNIQLSLNPPHLVSINDFNQFNQCLDAMRHDYQTKKQTLLGKPLPNPVTQPVVFHTEHDALEKSLATLATQHEQTQNALLEDFLTHTGFSIVANQAQSDTT